MKYTIEGFSQEKLVQLSLDTADALILRWFVDFSGSGNMKRIFFNNTIYYLVLYKGILEDLPILGITSTKAIGNRFDKYVQKGLLKKTYKRYGNGTLLFFSPTPLLLNLQYNFSKSTTKPVIKDELDDSSIFNFTQERQIFPESAMNDDLDCFPQSMTEQSTTIKEDYPHYTEQNFDSFQLLPKGTSRVIRKEVDFPSERKLDGYHFKYNSSTKNSSTTNSLTKGAKENLFSQRQSSSVDNPAATVFKQEFAKRININLFSSDFWESVPKVFAESGFTVSDIPDFVDFLFDYANKNKADNISNYLYKTTGYAIAQFKQKRELKKSFAQQNPSQPTSKHRCPLCTTVFEGSNCPDCGLAINQQNNEQAIREATQRYKGWQDSYGQFVFWSPPNFKKNDLDSS